MSNLRSPQPLPQLGQVRGRGVRSAHQRMTVKHILCAAGVRNISVKAVHMHTVTHVLNGVLVKAGRAHGVYTE